MRKLVIGLVLALVVVGMGITVAGTPKNGVLVIGTWNLRGYPETSPDRATWFTNTLPLLGVDILCVQEIANQDRVNKFLNTEVSFSSAVFADSSDGQDNAIFFGSGIQMVDISDPVGFQHPAQAVYFRYQGLDAMLITVHLSYKDTAQRTRECDSLVNIVQQALKVDEDVIIAGDFNIKDESDIAGLAESLGLEILKPLNPDIGTMYATGYTYDYILVSPHLYDEEALFFSEIIDFDDEEIASAVSNHRPVTTPFLTAPAYGDCIHWPPQISDSWCEGAKKVVSPTSPILFLDIVSVTSPVQHGSYATLAAHTVPSARCTITVYYKSGRSKAAGLYAKKADHNGNVSWQWKVGTRTTPGTWRIVVTASFAGSSTSFDTSFTVQ